MHNRRSYASLVWCTFPNIQPMHGREGEKRGTSFTGPFKSIACMLGQNVHHPSGRHAHICDPCMLGKDTLHICVIDLASILISTVCVCWARLCNILLLCKCSLIRRAGSHTLVAGVSHMIMDGMRASPTLSSLMCQINSLFGRAGTFNTVAHSNKAQIK